MVDEDLILYVLDGLGLGSQDFVTGIIFWHDINYIDKLYHRLVLHEQRNKQIDVLGSTMVEAIMTRIMLFRHDITYIDDASHASLTWKEE